MTAPTEETELPTVHEIDARNTESASRLSKAYLLALQKLRLSLTIDDVGSRLICDTLKEISFPENF